jgi:hypothetical protein
MRFITEMLHDAPDFFSNRGTKLAKISENSRSETNNYSIFVP